MVTILVWLPLHVEFEFRRIKSDDHALLEVKYLFGLIRWRRQLLEVESKPTDEGPALSVQHVNVEGEAGVHSEQSSSGSAKSAPVSEAQVSTLDLWVFLRRWRTWKWAYEQSKPAMLRFLRRLVFRQLSIDWTIGTSDVVTTGVAYGSAWATTMSLLGPLSGVAHFDQSPRVNITADFQRPRFEGATTCILEVRLGYAILAGLRLLRVWRRVTAKEDT